MSAVDQHLSTGNLAGAIDAATAAARSSPLAPEHRLVLAELLCFRGEFDRADKLVDAAMQMRSGPAPGLILFRQLLRGEVARQQFYDEGRVPEFRWEPGELERAALEAAVELRGGNVAAAAQVLQSAEERSPSSRRGSITLRTGESKTFDGFRDLDDLEAHVVTAYAMNGKFFLFPWSRVKRLVFNDATTLRDRLWRAVTATFSDGEEAQAFVPCLYAGTWRESDDALRVGQGSDWRTLDGGITRGVGLRMFLAGEETPTILDLKEIEFDDTDGPAAAQS
jgi:type VI secretion system protein ImpE